MDTCCLFESVVFGHNPKFVGCYENQVNIIDFLLKNGYGEYIFMTFIVLCYTLRQHAPMQIYKAKSLW